MTRAAARLTAGWERGFPGPAGRFLGVVGGGYRGLLGAREWLYARGVLRSRGLGCPVVSIGNVTLGGTGKTPAVELAAQTLAQLGRHVAIVSRGYGRRSAGIQVVADTASIRLDAEDAGDEPFLLARRLPGVPVVVGGNRHRAAVEAVGRFAVNAIVLDDGFQHRTLRKDLEIVMARAERPWGNGHLLPAGPLREPLGALRRADLVVAVGARREEEATEVMTAVAQHAPGVPVLLAEYVPTDCWEVEGMRRAAPARLTGMRLLAFAGIGSPRAFERTLADVGATVAEVVAFPDHHWYSREEIVALDRRAAGSGAAALVTTEKDWVRLRRLPPPTRPLFVLSVRLALRAGEAEWRAAFERVCSTR